MTTLIPRWFAMGILGAALTACSAHGGVGIGLPDDVPPGADTPPGTDAGGSDAAGPGTDVQSSPDVPVASDLPPTDDNPDFPDVPRAPVCGDGRCDSSLGETCTTCPTDCGACVDPCSTAGSTCDSCAAAGCGWCRNLGRCLSGGTTGPIHGECSGSNWVQPFGACTVTDPCAAATTCGACASSTCGWCRDTGVCVTGSSAGPIHGECSLSNWSRLGAGCGGTPYPRYTRTSGSVAFIDACSLPSHTTLLPSTDDGATTVALPFPFLYWGTAVTASLGVTSNGFINVAGSTTASTGGILPSTAAVGDIAPYWVDLITRTGICVGTTGSPGSQRLVIEWDNAEYYSGMTGSLTFEAVLSEGSNAIDFIYQSISAPAPTGYYTAVGLVNQSGTSAVTLCAGSPVTCTGVATGSNFHFQPSL